jgi:hypothetical protein
MLVTLLVLFSLSSFLSAQDRSKGFSEYGELLITRLASAPFPHPSRASGHVYAKQLYTADKCYSDSSVAIFIPMGYRKTDSVDLVVHLHGWRRIIDTSLQKHKLAQQLTASGKNAILVVPQGPRDAPDSFAGKLEDPGGLKRFVDDVVDFLYRESKIKTRTAGKVILTAHSGGYEGVAYALMRGGIPEKVKEVYLFDALYGEEEKFAHWVDHYNGKLINIYTDSGGTRWDSEMLMQDLEGWKVPYCAKTESSLRFSDLQQNQWIFIHSDLEHEMVLAGRMQFRDFLKASCLSNR